jgi:3-deoxy-7-phosphoheptulonate synthase
MLYHAIDDLRIANMKPLIPPAILLEELPADEVMAAQVAGAREAVSGICTGSDPRLLVVAGPCSIHDVTAALEYAGRLKPLSEKYQDALCVVMRVYFEKPRTTVGWKGLINDPDLDNSFKINHGLRQARGLLCELARMGLPAGCEFLDTITPQFIADLVTWGAIGARTTESQVHRELASGLSVPVGFKNGTDGSIQIAVDAIQAASHPHHFLSVTKQGLAAIVATTGNDACHLILRGSDGGPNYDREAVADAASALEAAGLRRQLMVDCSHGNSRKDANRQPIVDRDIAHQLAEDENCPVMGVMLESHLVAGRQTAAPGAELTYGQSITDACIGWDDTLEVLETLGKAMRRRMAA